MRGRQRHWVVPLVAWALACLAGPAAQGQPQLAPVQPFNVVDIGGEVFFESTYREENETTGRDRVKSEDTLLRLEEGIQVDMDAYVYHPNLLDLNGSVRVGLQNEFGQFNEEERDSDGLLLGYNLSALAFREKPVSIHAFARRFENTVNRSFTRTTDITLEHEGVEMIVKGKLPVTLSVEHLKQDESSANREDNKESIFYRAFIEDRRDSRFYNSLEYRFDDVDEISESISTSGQPTIVQDLSHTRHTLNYANRWQWGDLDRPHELTGGARLQKRNGAFNEQFLHLFERLDLRHTPTFSTYYEFDYNEDDSEERDEREMEGRVGFLKQIYESLNLDGNLRAVHNQIDDSTISSFGGFLDADYRKRTPAGMYTAFLDLGLEYDTQTSDDDFLRIANESHTLSGVVPETLNSPNVESGTIRVTDATNTIVYIEGVDYLVRRLGSFVEIERLIGGGIGDGETVLVDYNTLTARDADFITSTIAIGQRLDLKWIPVSVYGELRYRDESLQSGMDPGNLEQEEILRVGAQLRLGPVIVLGEYETRDSRVSPSWDLWRAEAHFAHRVTSNIFFTADARYEFKQFTDGLSPNDQRADYLEIMSASASLNTRVTSHLLLRLEGSYYETTGRDNDTLGRIGSSLEWSYGRMDVSLNAYYEIYEQEEDNGDRVFVGIRVSRSF